MPEPDELEAMTAYEMAATVDFGLEAKQGLLDLRSENARLRLVTRLFRAARQAPGLHRARAGAGALEREGPLRLRPAAAARAASQEPARIRSEARDGAGGEGLAEQQDAVDDGEAGAT